MILCGAGIASFIIFLEKGEDMKNQEGTVSMRKTRLQEFIQFCIDCEALQFGTFTLKSGRDSPYFFNSGKFCTGKATKKLAHAYAQTILAHRITFDGMFGPAYKGIPLVVSVADAYDVETGRDTPWSFDRKEVKGHGEGGSIVGAPIEGKVLMLDDVATTGATKYDAAKLIETNGGTLAGIVTAFDRQERGADSVYSAAQELEKNLNVKVVSVITLGELMNYLEGFDPEIIISHHNNGWPVTARHARDSIKEYQNQYGV